MENATHGRGTQLGQSDAALGSTRRTYHAVHCCYMPGGRTYDTRAKDGTLDKFTNYLGPVHFRLIRYQIQSIVKFVTKFNQL